MSESEHTRLIRRVGDGLVSWLAFERSAKRPVPHEPWLYKPISEIASSRGWEVFDEFQHPRKSRSRVDFAFFGATNVISLTPRRRSWK